MTTPPTNPDTPQASASGQPGTDDCRDTSCREAVEELYVYLDGELDEARRTTIKTHVDECEPCLAMFDFHLELKVMVSQKCRTELPTGLRARVLLALESFDEPDA